VISIKSKRYDRLGRYQGLGESGLSRLRDAKVSVAGCGGLGGSIITMLARYPVGEIRLIDRDVVDETNLAHQALVFEHHIAQLTPKVVAATEYISTVNSDINAKALFYDIRSNNADELLSGSDIVIDGLDNFATRFIINDWCVKNSVPYIYGGLVESEASMKVVIPGKTSCLRCLVPGPPEPGTVRTCDAYGVHLPIIPFLSAAMVDAAIGILIGNETENTGAVIEVRLSLEGPTLRIISASMVQNPDCPTCQGKFEFLDNKGDNRAISVCGQNAIAISLDTEIAPSSLTDALGADFNVSVNPYLIRAMDESNSLVYTVFSHGRVILEGSDDETKLRSFISKYIGN